MQHSMKLFESAYENISSGRKTLELRLNDEKRRRISIGDTIEFRKLPELIESIKCEVTGLFVYTDFDELVRDIPPQWFGRPEYTEDFVDRCYDIYPAERVERYGVLGIKIKLLAQAGTFKTAICPEPSMNRRDENKPW